MTNSNNLKLGFAVPIFANPGVVDVRTPNFQQLEWQPVLAAVQEAESLGYDSIWVADHMFLGRDGAILEGWTTLCVLAGATNRIRLGNIHLGNGFRWAPLTAKMAATLDVISGGRFEFFIDPGWREREHVGYGFDWEPDRSVRAAQVGEAVELSRLLWTGKPVDYQGRHYTLSGAISTPVPVRQGGPRVWIGEAFDEATMDLVARHADVWNSMPAGIDVLRDKIAKVDAACVSRGRDPQTLEKTLETQVLVVDSEAEWRQWLERWDAMHAAHPPGDAMTDFFEFAAQTNPQLGAGVDEARLRDEFVIGTKDEVIDKLRAYQHLGISEVICWFMDFPESTTMTVLASEIRPALEGGR
ncbi:LLM class flavin-dependent oxidoreductase [Acrocarpospora catenulata]|uniref:LLM class flavin-dependent oxidoreductase n=1 Tax=Acrocarpospora catenulata TaxID=2836182 RepID=UPI001BD990E0|nr:LLM class flavin-dependent oxidoreductase [Acrocarpospora catenulata]